MGNYLFEQRDVESALESFPHVDVFICHNSPRDIHDRDDEVHHGFSAFGTYMNNKNPRYLIHGHQHVNEETFMHRTKVIGIYGHKYLVIEEE